MNLKGNYELIYDIYDTGFPLAEHVPLSLSFNSLTNLIEILNSMRRNFKRFNGWDVTATIKFNCN